MRKMNWNNVGRNVRKVTDGISSKIFGIMKPSKLPSSKIQEEWIKKSDSYNQMKKVVNEIELKKSRAIEFVRRFQNR